MRRAIFAALFILASCSGSKTDSNNDGIADGVVAPNDVSVIAPSTPVGNISGTVLDADGAPLANATVTSSIDPTKPAKTDSTGHFSFTNQPAGSSVGLTISLSGYTTASLQTTIPSAAGNVPIDNATAFVGPVRLFATTGSLNVTVVGFDGKLLSPNAVLQISPAYTLDSTGSGGGNVVVHATGANGLIGFTDIPDLGELARLTGSSAGYLSLAVEPLDANSDGTIDYGGATLQISAADALASPGSLSVVLPPPSQAQGNLQIVGSNCGTLVSTSQGGGGPAGSLIQSSDSVFVAFNQPVVPSSLSVSVLDDDGTPIDVGSPALVNGGTGTVVSFGGTFPGGHAMSVSISATASASRPARSVTFSGACFVAPASGPGPSVLKATYQGATNAALTPGEVVHLEFDSSIGNETQAPQLSAYFDADLDNDGKRQSVGEYDPNGRNTSPGFPVTVDASQPSVLGGHFSRFYSFTYTQVGLTAVNVTANRPVYVMFNDGRTAGDTSAEWVTGAALTASNPAQGFISPVQ
ncbi:MAG: carboxypeptidase regulatory-like domain-containing protein [Deltaproteobacteria bacterium]|nr:carboxypeptidase regulatory-like domain-containing protein [Deltaproteobacteria bacterium]